MKPFAILAAVLAVSVTQPVAGEPTTRQISVTGEGQSEAQPDMATITLGVTHQAKTARDEDRLLSQGL